MRANYWFECVKYEVKRSVQSLLNAKNERVMECAAGPCNCGDSGDGGNGSPCDGACGSGEGD